MSVPEKGHRAHVTSSPKIQTPADWLPVSDVNLLIHKTPCLLHRFCSNLVKLTTYIYYTAGLYLNLSCWLPSGRIWRSKIEFTVKNQQLCSRLSHIKNGNTRKQRNACSTSPVMWRFCHSSNAAVTSETKVCAGARSAQPGNKLCGLR